MRRAATGGAAVLLCAAAFAAGAPAYGQDRAREGTPGSRPAAVAADELRLPESRERPPPGRELSAEQAMRIADREEKVVEALADYADATREAFLKGARQWQVSYYDRPADAQGERGEEIAQVLIDDRSGEVLEAWTGFQVAWTMARGYDGAFGRKANALYVWLPLLALFLAAFVDRRAPLRRLGLLQLDLAVLAAFSISFAFFTSARIDWSVPLAYPPLVYLLVRLVLAARRSESWKRAGPLPLAVPVAWLAVGLIFLTGFRVGLNVTNSNVIDVGYSGVIGADRLADGDPLYGGWPPDNQHGDTYGPVAYYAYVPFEQAWSWSGRWDDLPAAHGGAVAFDLAVIAALLLLGRRLRGWGMGIAMAFAWAAFPFTLLASSSNANDSLVAALVALALLVASSAPARGAAIALAGMTKFAPLGLGPLFATHRGARDGPRAWRRAALFALAFAGTAAIALAPVLFGGNSLRDIYDSTAGFQATRGSPFSVWGYRGDIDALQLAVQAGAVAFALAAAAIPRRRDLVGLAALTAAVLIALQLGITHWFYLYIVWFMPPLLVALMGRFDEPRTRPAAP